MAMTYEALLASGGGYAFHLESLAETGFFPSVDKLVVHVNNILAEIDSKAPGGKKLASFMIKNSYARRKHDTAFNLDDPATWNNAKGVQADWQEYQGKGYDGLICIAGVNRQISPKTIMKKRHHGAETYAVALMQALLHRLSYGDKPDKRLHNADFHARPYPEKAAHVGVVFIVYKLADPNAAPAAEPEPEQSE